MSKDKPNKSQKSDTSHQKTKEAAKSDTGHQKTKEAANTKSSSKSSPQKSLSEDVSSSSRQDQSHQHQRQRSLTHPLKKSSSSRDKTVTPSTDSSASSAPVKTYPDATDGLKSSLAARDSAEKRPSASPNEVAVDVPPSHLTDDFEMSSAAVRAMRSRTFSLSKSGRVKEKKRRSMTISGCFDGEDLTF